jgi:hypothetical protein
MAGEEKREENQTREQGAEKKVVPGARPARGRRENRFGEISRKAHRWRYADLMRSISFLIIIQ